MVKINSPIFIIILILVLIVILYFNSSSFQNKFEIKRIVSEDLHPGPVKTSTIENKMTDYGACKVSNQLGCKIVEGSTLYDSIKDAVVMISVNQSWQGTGFFVSKDGYIVTAAHVISEPVDEKEEKGAIQPAKDIFVLVSPHYDVYKCRVVGIDGVGDIGVLKIDMDDSFNQNNHPITNQRYLPFLEKAKTGELAYVLGYPLGTDLSSFSMGIVRNERFVAPSLFIPFNVVLITSPAYQGNSGSPIVNVDGDVIGLLTFVYYANEQTFESIGGGPSSSIVSYVAEKLITADKLKKNGMAIPAYFDSHSLKFRKGYLGFESSKVVWFSDIPTLSKKYNFPHKTPIGFRGNIGPFSPLKGLISNKDVIVRIDDKEIGALPNQTAPGDILWRKIPGDKVKIEYYPMDGYEYGPLKTINVTLLEYPDSVDTFEGRALKVEMDCIGDECSFAKKKSVQDDFYIPFLKHTGF
jgi:S1-C subfamily serine protease